MFSAAEPCPVVLIFQCYTYGFTLWGISGYNRHDNCVRSVLNPTKLHKKTRLTANRYEVFWTGGKIRYGDEKLQVPKDTGRKDLTSSVRIMYEVQYKPPTQTKSEIYEFLCSVCVCVCIY